jgi:tRNA threonylcarbamoyladenosine biosynthesis protein TsaE
MTWQTKSISSEATEQLAEQLGKTLRGGEVIELVSDLGGGKTTFVRGLARGAGSADKVASPTFTISKVYSCPRFEIHHFDFYRLDDPGIVADELAEIVGDPKTVVVVEWGDVVQHVLPAQRLTITITQTADENSRQLSFACHPDYAYLVKAVQ